MPQSKRICPNCKQTTIIYIFYNPYQERFVCTHCGNFYLLTKVRDVTDVDNDYGKYKFVSCLDPWGYVEIHFKSGETLNNAVSAEESDNFLNWLDSKKSEIKYTTMSYLDSDGKIKTKFI